jgi:hypothetical protein
MSLNLLKDIKSALAQLNPADVRRMSERSVSLGIAASSDSSYQAIESFLGGGATAIVSTHIHRVSANSATELHDVVLCAPDTACPPGCFVFLAENPQSTVEAILDAKQELEISLARQFPVFRQTTITRIIQRTARENAMFSLVTALPNVVPNLLELPWAVGEFATDTAFLTINQVRMAFLIAAANGKPVGYAEQKVELASIAAGAFGWRAIARELIGKIPLGGGLIPKTAIAFAGTYVVGLGLERLHRTGTPLKGKEAKDAYALALEKGKGIARSLISGIKNSGVKKRNVA